MIIFVQKLAIFKSMQNHGKSIDDVNIHIRNFCVCMCVLVANPDFYPRSWAANAGIT
jgi:hypothetical protein